MTSLEDTPRTKGVDSPRLAEALRYARKGWRVLPVFPGEKRPRLKAWQNEATTETGTIREWWQTMPDSNVGLATGRESGFFVLDIDPKSNGDEALEALEAEHGALPRTFAVRTGSGGTHFYFLPPDDFEVTNSPGRLNGTGIDVRGEGGQVLAPPSRTVIGEYRTKHDDPIVAAPEWLLDLIRPKADLRVVVGESTEPGRIAHEDFDGQRDYSLNALRSAAKEVGQTTEGGRNQTLNDQVLALAGIAAHHELLLEEHEAHDAMLEACEANGLIAADGRRSFEQTFRSAWSAGLTKPRQDWPPRQREGAGIAFGAQHGGRPVVNVTGKEYHALVDEILGHIVASNHDDPTLFMHGTEVVSITGEPAKTTPISEGHLSYEASTRMMFVRDMPNGGTTVIKPPEREIRGVHEHHEKPLPRINRVSYTPFFSPSGRLVMVPGYDEESRTFYSPDASVTIPDVPEEPTTKETRAALGLVLDDLLVDFPFATNADRTHAVALLLLPFVRDLIHGATPLHDIEAPTPGSGKGLLMKTLLMPGVGPKQSVMSAAGDDAEWQKRLVTFLRDAPQAVVIDNVNTKIDSGSLCTVLTEPVYAGRLLGQNTSVSLPVRCMWVLTANNPQMSGEVSRRCLRIRLDPQIERPEEREGFRHADLASWTADNRGLLIAAACTLVRSWVVAGMPKSSATWGSFEEWAHIIGGIVEHLGLEDFLGNRRDFVAAADEESAAWEALVGLLVGATNRITGRAEWSSKEIAEMVEEAGLDIDLGPSANRALMMGRALSKQRDRWHRGSRFESRMVGGKAVWSLTTKPSL